MKTILHKTIQVFFGKKMSLAMSVPSSEIRRGDFGNIIIINLEFWHRKVLLRLRNIVAGTLSM